MARNRETLGEASSEEDVEPGRNIRNQRTTKSVNLRSIVNPYDRPSTSKSAADRGELHPPRNIPQSNSKQQTELCSMPVRGAARRKPKTFAQRNLQQIREMIKLQKSTKLQIPRAPFARIVREITMDITKEVTQYTLSAMDAIHEATEMYIHQVLQDAYLLTLHRNRVTLSKQDLDLLRALRLNM